MTKTEIKIMQDTISKTIQTTVNGKIDQLKAQITEHNRKHEADMEEIRPYIQGVMGLGYLWKIIIGLIGALVLWGQLKQLFPNL